VALDYWGVGSSHPAISQCVVWCLSRWDKHGVKAYIIVVVLLLAAKVLTVLPSCVFDHSPFWELHSCVRA
jgi:hypothetical protein